MCGICGIFDMRGHLVPPELVEKMTAAIRHRGPDGSGSFVSGEIGLGHRRLSIIDLEGGAQPISNEDDSLQVVFNGEIYNYLELRQELKASGHIFKTETDTEVIVHSYEQWGMDCVKRFNGIFAFALWDVARKTLVLARDHLGVKPLYYLVVGHRLLFASEVKALLADPNCPREVDVKALSTLFSLRCVPSPDTLFAGIKKLPPAHILVACSRGIDVKQYWDWTPKIRHDTDEQSLIEEYQELVEDAVRLQMRSDVPVGLFLSSGVDSGALLALMTKYGGSPVHTFTIGFADGATSNETTNSGQLARRFGADHSEMIVSPKDYERYYEQYLWDLEEPVGNETAAAFYFVSLLTSRKVKVALTGQGADELWAGYHRYIGVKLSQLYSRLPRSLTEGAIAPLANRLTNNERIRRGVHSLTERDMLKRFVKVHSYFTADMREKLFQPWVKEMIGPNGDEAARALRRLQSDVQDLDPLTQLLYIDTRTNLPDDLLMVADKTSMTNSIEVRVPFLDYRIVEFIETLPPHMKLRGLQGKYLHKKASEKWVPRDVAQRKKKGFANPIDQWLRGPMKALLKDSLATEKAAVRKYFNPAFVDHLLTEHEAGRHNYLLQIYTLLSFELWHERFIAA